MSMDTYEFKPDDDSPRMAIKDWVTLPSDYTSMPIPADLQSISGSSDISDCSENSNTSMVIGDDVAPAKRVLQTLHSVSSMHPEFQQLARLITSAASVTSKMKSETPTPEETPTAKSRRRNTDTDTRMTSEAEQLDGSRNRKNTREKQRRQEIQSKFDVLSDMLGLEPSIGQNGKTMKPDKSDILVATISHISELKKDNQDLQDEKVAITTQLFALASQLTPMRQQCQPFVASGGVQHRIKQFEGMASIPEHGAMASLPSPPQPQTHAPSTPLPPH